MRRSFQFTKIEHRVASSGGSARVIYGHAAVFELTTELRPGLRERVARGAFSESIQVDDIACLFNHEANLLLGRNSSKTMRIAEDDRGLAFETDVDERQSYVHDLLISIDRGDVRGGSFGFEALRDSVVFDRQTETMTRTLEKAKLWDVGPVTFPAYPQTDTGARAARIDGVSLDDIAAAYATLASGASDAAAVSLVRSAARALAAVAGPPPPNQERMNEMRRRLDLAARVI